MGVGGEVVVGFCVCVCVCEIFCCMLVLHNLSIYWILCISETCLRDCGATEIILIAYCIFLFV